MPFPAPHQPDTEFPSIGHEWIAARQQAGPLVWLHGLGSSSTGGFANIAQRPELRDVASLLIDLPGHGRSGKPLDWSYSIEANADAVAAFLRAQVQDPVVLMGHSLGGSVAISLAYRHPDLVSHLIAAEPGLDPGRGVVSLRIARQSESDFVEHGYHRLLRSTERLAAQGSIEARAWLPDLSRAIPQALHRAACSLLADRSPTFREQLASLPMPVSLITGESSSHVMAPVPAPHLRGYVVRDAGHHLHVNNPPAFATILAAIMAEHSLPESPS